MGSIPHHRKSKKPTEDGNDKVRWRDKTPAAARPFASFLFAGAKEKAQRERTTSRQGKRPRHAPERRQEKGACQGEG